MKKINAVKTNIFKEKKPKQYEISRDKIIKSREKQKIKMKNNDLIQEREEQENINKIGRLVQSKNYPFLSLDFEARLFFSSFYSPKKLFKNRYSSYERSYPGYNALFFSLLSSFFSLFIKKEKIEREKIKKNKRGNIFIFYLLIFSNIINSNSGIIKQSNELKDSYITLKVNGNGNIKILSNSDCGTRYTMPDKVYINDELQSTPVNKFYDLNPTKNIKLVWEGDISHCLCMFRGCEFIEEINFIKFDISKCDNVREMFRDCHSLTTLDLSVFDTSNVVHMWSMFYNCYSLNSLNISNFKTSKVINLGHMFYNCSSLKSLYLYNFDTSHVIRMDNLFNGCSNLTSINLSNFETFSVNSISNMFKDCISLTSVDISNFDTSLVTDMNNLFYNCKLLTSINISNFDTKSTDLTDNMFNGCESLKILDFSNFNSTSIINKNDMFLNCGNLEYINFKNYNSNIILNSNFFKSNSKNYVVCLENEILVNITENPECITIKCGDNWKDFRKKINTKDNSCTDDCTMTEYQFEYKYNCIPNCLNGTYNNNYKCEDCLPECKECEGANNDNCISCSSPDKFLKFGKCVNSSECLRGFYLNNITNQKTCKCDLENCYKCSLESLNKNLCISCESDYYPIYNDKYDIYYPFLNCSRSPEGYYLDKSVYKLCYPSCKTCNISGNEIEHNCIECKDGFNFEIKFESYKNCYDNCTFYHYYIEDKRISYCTKDFECPNQYDKLIDDKRECVSNCNKDDDYKFEFKKHCYSSCPLNSAERININEVEIFSLNSRYFCKPICSKEVPFEMINTQECVKCCDFKDIINKSCILNIEGDKKVKIRMKKWKSLILMASY